MKYTGHEVSEWCNTTAMEVIICGGLDLFLSTLKHRTILHLMLVQVSRVYFESITGTYLA